SVRLKPDTTVDARCGPVLSVDARRGPVLSVDARRGPASSARFDRARAAPLPWGPIQLGQPISLFHIRALTILAVALLSASCGSPTRPTVVVPPTDPPALTCPTVDPAASTDGTPIPVSYSDPVISGGQQPFTLSCT